MKFVLQAGLLPGVVKLASRATRFSQKWLASDLEVCVWVWVWVCACGVGLSVEIDQLITYVTTTHCTSCWDLYIRTCSADSHTYRYWFPSLNELSSFQFLPLPFSLHSHHLISLFPPPPLTSSLPLLLSILLFPFLLCSHCSGRGWCAAVC